MIKEFKPYYEIGKDEVGVVARVFQEERKLADLKLRVVHAQIYGRERVERDNWEFNKHAESEKKATINVFELMNDGYEMVVWLSPKSEIYEEGRLNIMLKTEVEGRLGFDPWGIPLLKDEKETMDLAEKLLAFGGVTMDGIGGVEDLREEPIGFHLENEDWVEKCRELMPEYEEVWDFIKKGGVEENMEKIVEEVRWAKKIAKGNNVVFEMEMFKRGYELNVAGGHGGSWLSQAGRGVGLFEIFDSLKIIGKMDERLSKCEGCGCYFMKKKGKCPKCGKGSK
jgi:hypothetical protein